MDWKKTAKALLFPHTAVLVVLLPAAAAGLVYALAYADTASPSAVAAYVLAAYTLTVWCCSFPRILRRLQKFGAENRYVRRWREDARLRMNVSLYGTLLWNAAYAVLQLGLGIWHRTFWFCSLAGYYAALAVMRFFLARYTRRYAPGERLREELVRYRACGIVFLIMNLALALIIFFMVYWNRTFRHHEITTIAIAAYTFATLAKAVVNAVRSRRDGSPVYAASRAISLAAACVSMLVLESTMLTTFGDGTMAPAARRLLLGVSGGALSLFIIVMAVYMIAQANKKIRLLKRSGGTKE